MENVRSLLKRLCTLQVGKQHHLDPDKIPAESEHGRIVKKKLAKMFAVLLDKDEEVRKATNCRHVIAQMLILLFCSTYRQKQA